MLKKYTGIIVVLFSFIIITGYGGAAMGFELTSDAFKDGGLIPLRHTCDGSDLSPRLMWSEPPGGTGSFALVCDDPDAPAGTWVHWVIYEIPVTVTALAEGIAHGKRVKTGIQGRNDFGKIGYNGPCPPAGPAHRYFFRLYALDAELSPAPGMTKDELLSLIKGHVLALTELMGRYGR